MGLISKKLRQLQSGQLFLQAIPQIFEAFLYLMARSAEGLKFGKGNGPEKSFIRRGVFSYCAFAYPFATRKAEPELLNAMHAGGRK